MMGEILVHEKKYINQEDTHVVVSFQLSSRDWWIIENSDAWHKVEKAILKGGIEHAV